MSDNSNSPALAVRLATESDQTFIKASWFQSYHHGGFCPEIRYPLFRAGQDRAIDVSLSKGRTLVCYATQEPTEICGWVCSEGEALHYIYTKQSYRKLGIATFLLTKLVELPSIHTHRTRAYDQRLLKHLKTQYNPYSLYR